MYLSLREVQSILMISKKAVHFKTAFHHNDAAVKSYEPKKSLYSLKTTENCQERVPHLKNTNSSIII